MGDCARGKDIVGRSLRSGRGTYRDAETPNQIHSGKQRTQASMVSGPATLKLQNHLQNCDLASWLNGAGRRADYLYQWIFRVGGLIVPDRESAQLCVGFDVGLSSPFGWEVDLASDVLWAGSTLRDGELARRARWKGRFLDGHERLVRASEVRAGRAASPRVIPSAIATAAECAYDQEAYSRRAIWVTYVLWRISISLEYGGEEKEYTREQRIRKINRDPAHTDDQTPRAFSQSSSRNCASCVIMAQWCAANGIGWWMEELSEARKEERVCYHSSRDLETRLGRRSILQGAEDANRLAHGAADRSARECAPPPVGACGVDLNFASSLWWWWNASGKRGDEGVAGCPAPASRGNASQSGGSTCKKPGRNTRNSAVQEKIKIGNVEKEITSSGLRVWGGTTTVSRFLPSSPSCHGLLSVLSRSPVCLLGA
ncbi:hypothetical protein DFP72DRAFT_1150013 [Ephemerocybe angulata]|uniref:Uncharacterized protein n=1 Tax=Ephemerocybe angulata TaxID=980116 RepID=A0A8H6LYY4_9AGAR|nr:hypothetical protein DFP72DRAFT_1150013 [Tulosesus angulatus]